MRVIKSFDGSSRHWLYHFILELNFNVIIICINQSTRLIVVFTISSLYAHWFCLWVHSKALITLFKWISSNKSPQLMRFRITGLRIWVSYIVINYKNWMTIDDTTNQFITQFAGYIYNKVVCASPESKKCQNDCRYS